MPKHKNNVLGPRPHQVRIKVNIMLKAQVQAITTFTTEEAGPPENNICSSYRSGMTRLVLVQEHFHIRCRPNCSWCRRQGIYLHSQKNGRPRPNAIIENDLLSELSSWSGRPAACRAAGRPAECLLLRTPPESLRPTGLPRS